MSATQGLQFSRAGGIYWLELFPAARRERRAWSSRAEEIPDRALRRDAQLTLQTKWGHSEGAAAFAILVPRSYRRRFVRMAIAYELVVDYLDTTSERPADDPFGNTFRLHQALFAALGAEPVEGGDWYSFHPQSDDGGYLAAQVAACREIFLSLPSSRLVAGRARRLAILYAEAQGLYHSIEAGTPARERAEQTNIEADRHPELQWGEMLAGGASSLPVLALMAAAACPGLSDGEAERIAAAYYPWTSSLHILLHGLVHRDGDRASGQFNQLNHYRCGKQTAERLAFIASRARLLVSRLPQGEMHATLLAGMGGYYLAPRQAWTLENGEISRTVLDSLDPMTRAALLIHRIRRAAPARPRA
jgi:tetraprenyl-beta-curcumene synthase